MKILHISNNYYDSKVHRNLYMSIDNLGITQFIYTYFDKKEYIGCNKFEGKRTEFVYSCILNRLNRIYYPYKEYYVYKDLKSKLTVNSFNIIHATTLFSDGGLAYKIYKEFEIPYIVAVRSTDVDSFMRIKLYWKYGRRILLNASKIIFISNRLKEKFINHNMVKPIIDLIKDKIEVVPNGIDQYWIDNVYRGENINNHSITYIGRFQKRKNVPMLIEAVNLLAKKYPDICLNIIGKGDEDEDKVKEMAANSKYIKFVGPVCDKNIIREYLSSSSVFAMVSVGETYGLVYVEALSQNKILLYTKDDGIDGTFKYNIGEGIKPNVENIINAVIKIFSNPLNYDGNKYIDFTYFDWNNIANKYIEFYKNI